MQEDKESSPTVMYAFILAMAGMECIICMLTLSIAWS